MKKNMCKIFCSSFILLLIFSAHSFAMSRYEFDKGMKKGIEYFDKQMYYEARDEFQWFCDYNWGQMSAGQQKYALDYLGGTKQAIFKMEVNYVNPNVNYQKFKEMVLKYGYYNKERNCYLYDEWYSGYTINILYTYNISSNIIVMSLLAKEDYGTIQMTISTDGNSNELGLLLLTLNDSEGIMYGGFLPYTNEITLIQNDFSQSSKSAILYYMEMIDDDLRERAGVSLKNLGIYYNNIINSMLVRRTL